VLLSYVVYTTLIIFLRIVKWKLVYKDFADQGELRIVLITKVGEAFTTETNDTPFQNDIRLSNHTHRYDEYD